MKTKRGNKHFQIHPHSQILDLNFYQRFTRSQFHEMKRFIKQFSVVEFDDKPNEGWLIMHFF